MPFMSSCARVAVRVDRVSRRSSSARRVQIYESTARARHRASPRRRASSRAPYPPCTSRATLPRASRALAPRASDVAPRSDAARGVTRARADAFAARRDADAARRDAARGASRRRRAREPERAGRAHEDAVRRVSGRGDAAVPDVQRHRTHGLDDRREHAAVRAARVRAGDDGRRARDGGDEPGGEGVRAVQRGDEEDAGEDRVRAVPREQVFAVSKRGLAMNSRERCNIK